ncbi:MAG: hypothetical protein ACJAT5_000168 [Lentimonas sp.]|jgi:hypothetical protein
MDRTLTTSASLYSTFETEEANRLTNRLEIHYTSKHGSWLNIAEIELRALNSKQKNLGHRKPYAGKSKPAKSNVTNAVHRSTGNLKLKTPELNFPDCIRDCRCYAIIDSGESLQIGAGYAGVGVIFYRLKLRVD